jgi:glucose-1-phosphate adenylyltransferase
MTDATIGPGAVVDRCIVDKEVTVDQGALVGFGDATVVNRLEPNRLTTGITIVGKRAHIPAGMRIGRNCMIDAGVRVPDYGGATEISSGGSVVRHTAELLHGVSRPPKSLGAA